MNRKTRWIGIGTLTLAFVGGGAGIAMASSNDGGADKPITEPALAKASAAALAYTHEGKVTETEVGDEDSYYEVEVTRPGGRQTDVQLDRNFKVVSSKTDHGDTGKDK
jgi:uncharacterized membrane protein YkoI